MVLCATASKVWGTIYVFNSIFTYSRHNSDECITVAKPSSKAIIRKAPMSNELVTLRYHPATDKEIFQPVKMAQYNVALFILVFTLRRIAIHFHLQLRSVFHYLFFFPSCWELEMRLLDTRCRDNHKVDETERCLFSNCLIEGEKKIKRKTKMKSASLISHQLKEIESCTYCWVLFNIRDHFSVSKSAHDGLCTRKKEKKEQTTLRFYRAIRRALWNIFLNYSKRFSH